MRQCGSAHCPVRFPKATGQLTRKNNKEEEQIFLLYQEEAGWEVLATERQSQGNAEIAGWPEAQARDFNPASSRKTILASLWLCAT